MDMILFIREEQADLMKRLSDLESKVIVGGVNLVGVNFVVLYVTLLSLSLCHLLLSVIIM